MIYNYASITTLKQINHLFKDFLWGFEKDTGHRKTPLVAWHRLTQPKDRGGSGFVDCKTHFQTLLSKWVSKALLEPTTKWAQLFIEIFVEFTWEQRRVTNRAQYSHLDRILLCLVRTYHIMQCTTGIWQAWAALRRHLLLSLEGNSICAHWRMEDILNHLLPYVNMDIGKRKIIILALRKLGITKAAHLWDSEEHTWKSFDTKL